MPQFWSSSIFHTQPSTPYYCSTSLELCSISNPNCQLTRSHRPCFAMPGHRMKAGAKSAPPPIQMINCQLTMKSWKRKGDNFENTIIDHCYRMTAIITFHNLPVTMITESVRNINSSFAFRGKSKPFTEILLLIETEVSFLFHLECLNISSALDKVLLALKLRWWNLPFWFPPSPHSAV